MSQSKTSGGKVTISERRERVMELRRKCWSIRRIADEVGASISTIHNDIKTCMKATQKRLDVQAELYLYEETERLDSLYADAYQIFEEATGAKHVTRQEVELKALEQCRKIRADFIKLWGLNGAEKLDLTTNGEPIGGGSIADLVAHGQKLLMSDPELLTVLLRMRKGEADGG